MTLFLFPERPLRADKKVKAGENKKGAGLERNCRIIKKNMSLLDGVCLL